MARDKPHLKEKCFRVAKIIACPINTNTLLCEFCGKIFHDLLEHYVCNCCHTILERDIFWNIITDTLDVQTAVTLFHLDDKAFVNTLLGAHHAMFNCNCLHSQFMVIAINFLCKLLDKVSLY